MSSWQPYGGSKIDEDRFFAWCSLNIDKFRIERSHDHLARGRCPFHNDKKPSLSIYSDSGFFLCRGSCAPKGREYRRFTYPEFCGKLGVPIDKSVYKQQYHKKISAAKDHDAVLYVYKNEYGEAVLRACVENDGSHYYQYRSGKDWLNGANELKLIYNKDRLTIADPGCCCFIVEGEKDAENLTKLGFLATTTPFGAKHDITKFRLEFMYILRFKHIVIIPDNDEPGRHYRDSVINLLCDLGGDEVRNKIKVLDIAAAAGVIDKGFDISDFIELTRSAGKDAKKELEQLLALLL